MTFIVGTILLALCTLTSAGLYRDVSNALHSNCKIFRQNLFITLPKMEKIFFELRSPCNLTRYPVTEANKLLSSPDFDINRKTVVMVNGWISSSDDWYSESLTKAYLCRGGYNFIMVNSANAQRIVYADSAYLTGKVGEFIAEGLKTLNIPGKDIHLMGHSLGSHVMGSAARHFASITGNKIGRVTGFDPARPCFIGTPPVFRRLSADDATFVDIIHSNTYEMGTEEVIGHADFYPGGLESNQTGCNDVPIPICSHVRSVDYFTESVYRGNENNFIGTQCENLTALHDRSCTGPKAPMGFAADEKSKGIYFLTVNVPQPYGSNAKSSKYLHLDTCGVCRQ